MIDFRYHLVSIVSIFLALAVGIVLGAGPLQQEIGTTLTSEVTQLRQDKSDLRSQVDELAQRDKARDAFITTMTPRLVGGLLSGRGVSVVTLPGAEAALTKTTLDTLRASGATITSEISILDAWTSTDPRQVEARTTVGNRLAQTLGLPATSAQTSSTVLDKVLAASLATSGPTPSNSGPTKEALTALMDARLIDTKTTSITPAQFIVVLSEPVSEGDRAAREKTVDAYIGLAQALDEGSSGAVVASDIGSSDLGNSSLSVVRVLRSNSAAADEVSTVDDLSLPIGQASVPIALSQQEDGASGHYGIGPGASAAYPPLPTP